MLIVDVQSESAAQTGSPAPSLDVMHVFQYSVLVSLPEAACALRTGAVSNLARQVASGESGTPRASETRRTQNIARHARQSISIAFSAHKLYSAMPHAAFEALKAVISGRMQLPTGSLFQIRARTGYFATFTQKFAITGLVSMNDRTGREPSRDLSALNNANCNRLMPYCTSKHMQIPMHHWPPGL